MRQRGSRLQGTAALLLITGLAGCTLVGPDYETPRTTVNQDWLKADARGLKRGAANYRSWWELFGDPVLNRLIETAYRQNLDVRAAGLRVIEARAQLGVAIGDFYPQTQQGVGGLSYERQSARAGQQPETTANRLEFWQNQLGAQLAWELDFWGRFRRGIESADAAFLSSIAAYDAALVTLTSDVAETYVSIRTTELRLKIARENVRVQEESLKIARARFQGGTTSERDVQQALTVLASTQATIPALETRLRQSENALGVLLGMAPGGVDAMLAQASGIPVAPAEVAVGVPADLLRRRPDVLAAELAAAAQSARIGLVKAELYPSISLIGNFGYVASDWTNYSLGDIFQSRSRAISFGPTLTWNFLNYGRITNNVRFQDALFQERATAYQNTVLRAQQEVEDGLIAFLNARERTRLLAEAAAAAQRSLDLSVLQYQQGITDFTTVLTAQQDLLRQQDDLVVSTGEVPSGLVRVYRALGGGWEIRDGDDFVPADVRTMMAKRTDWGNILTPVDLLQPAGPTLPTPANVSPRVRRPEF